MSLTPNTKLGPCEILSPFGAGGMGEVYRARDTRLDWQASNDDLAGRFGGTTSEYPVQIPCSTGQRRSFGSLNGSVATWSKSKSKTQ